MLGLWNKSYREHIPSRYGADESYLLAEKFLHGLDVEDWGCGHQRFKDYHVGGYIGIDGSDNGIPATITADLRERAEYSQGILLRHVLEHNRDWRKVLKNALKSYTHTLVIVLFTPLQERTHELCFTPAVGVPDIGFSLSDLRAELPAKVEEHLDIKSPSTQYGVEHLFVVRK